MRDRQLHRNDVDRAGDRLRQRHRAGIGVAVVLRAPVADADRAVDHDRGRLEAVHQRGGVDIGLERRAGLAVGVGGAVELAGAIVAAADHGADAAVEIGDHGRGLGGVIVAAELAQLVFDRFFGGALHVHVDRGADHEHALGVGLREGIDQLAHLVERPVEIIVRRILVAAVDRDGRIAPGAEHLALGHEAGIDQVVEHDVGAGARGGQVDVRRVFGRRLEQAGEHRGFREIDVAHRLVEVEMRRAVDAEGAAAHIGAVEIELQDLVLGEPRLQPDREERLVDLALDGALVGQEQVLRQLLGDRGAALAHAAGLRVGHQRAHGAGDVDAEMVVEAAVFGRQRRLDQIVRKILQRDRIVVLDAAAADRIAVAVEEGHREIGFLQPVFVGGFAKRRHRQRQHQDQPAEPDGGGLRQRFDEDPALPAADIEAVHEGRVALIEFARALAGREQRGVDARVEVQHQCRIFVFHRAGMILRSTGP